MTGSPIKLPGIKLLCVDDDTLVLETLVQMVEDLGCEAVAAMSAAEARAILADRERGPIRLVLTDCVMPGPVAEQGRFLAAHARERGIPAVLITGNPDRMALIEGTSFPVLRKPYNFATLRAIIEAALR